MTQEISTVIASVEVPSQEALIALYGSFDENMQVLESECGVKIRVSDRELTVEGEDAHVQVAVAVLDKMLEMIARKEPIDKSRVRYAVSLAREGQADLISQMMGDVVLVTHRGKQIKCRTVGQKKYIDAIRKNAVVFAVGPAGTGKTYLAMAMACLAIKNKEVSRIVLTRPAVEAGEKLGFLPGDLQNKVDPYLRPLYDALYDMLGQESYARLQEKGVIEVAPMAYMRGRTLNDADEDVPDPHGPGQPHGYHRRRHPDRPAGWQDQRPCRRHQCTHPCPRHRDLPAHRQGRYPPRAGPGHHPSL